MKTYKQFSEDMQLKKNFQTFFNNPETQDFLGKVKNTKIGNIGSLKKRCQKFYTRTSSTEFKNKSDKHSC